MELMPGFWEPRPNKFWNISLEPLRRYYLHGFYGIEEVELLGTENLKTIAPGDGALLAPNHSHDSDPHVMMDVGKTLGRQLYFMAAWQVFLAHKGIDGWVMQRMGAFSVDREGCDRRAMRQAQDLMTRGDWLVVFPEGEIYHTNERLTPLREGVAFMAITAQRDLDKASRDSVSATPASPSGQEATQASQLQNGRQIWIVPTAIKYTFTDDITPKLEAAMTNLESRLLLKTHLGTPLHERVIRFGEAMLTVKEKEKLGHSQEDAGDLPTRLHRLIDHLLGGLETRYFEKTNPDDSTPLRVKTLRHSLLEKMCDEKLPDDDRRAAKDALDDLHLVLQLYSYPGDYVSTKPSVERIAETVEKFEEDLLGAATRKGNRRATVRLGAPLDVKRHTTARARKAAAELTGRLETSISQLMST
jgi:1-acyl-sn-glycerol-3-phosphate acyltransferase